MTTLREAAQQALEALESKRFTSCGWRTDCDKAITALRAALAESVQKPHLFPLQSDRMRIDPVTGDVGIGTQIAEPVQEPVAWNNQEQKTKRAKFEPIRIRIMQEAYDLADRDDSEGYNSVKVMCSEVLSLIDAFVQGELTTDAPPQRKPLTEEEALEIARTFGAQPWPPGSCVAFARAVERAHGIGDKDVHC